MDWINYVRGKNGYSIVRRKKYQRCCADLRQRTHQLRIRSYFLTSHYLSSSIFSNYSNKMPLNKIRGKIWMKNLFEWAANKIREVYWRSKFSLSFVLLSFFTDLFDFELQSGHVLCHAIFLKLCITSTLWGFHRSRWTVANIFRGSLTFIAKLWKICKIFFESFSFFFNFFHKIQWVRSRNWSSKIFR